MLQIVSTSPQLRLALWTIAYKPVSRCYCSQVLGKRYNLYGGAVADVLGARRVAQRAQRLLDGRRRRAAAGDHQRQGRTALQRRYDSVMCTMRWRCLVRKCNR
jgi:hypothetical protein